MSFYAVAGGVGAGVTSGVTVSSGESQWCLPMPQNFKLSRGVRKLHVLILLSH